MRRFYIEPFFHHWIIKDSQKEEFLFGPFESEADAHFIMEMFNSEKLQLSKGDNHGEEDIKKSHTVY